MKKDLLENGFVVAEKIFTDKEIDDLLFAISQADTSKPTF